MITQMKIFCDWSMRITVIVLTMVLGFLDGYVPPCGAAPQAPARVSILRSGTDVNVSFDTLAGQTYGVERSDTLAAQSWSTVSSNLAGNGTIQVVTDTGGAGAQTRFYRVRYQVITPPAPAGFALIPSGSFLMGDVIGGGYSTELPVHSVYVSAFYMEQKLVTKAQWEEVYTWAYQHGYRFDFPYQWYGRAADHPILQVDWYDCVKWCNARSEKDGFVPCYTLNGDTFKTVTTSGIPVCDFGASGYRLPTEAEWEKAARGGAGGQRFPWGNTISRSQANYYGRTADYIYDQGPNGFNPTYYTGVSPYKYTSPGGAFPANGYGLYDMSGNLCQWCWDWDGSYVSEDQNDPTGPSSGTHRIRRGSSYGTSAIICRVSCRNSSVTNSLGDTGLRCVRR